MILRDTSGKVINFHLMMPALLPAASYVNLYGLLRQPLLSGLANPTVKPAEPLLLDGTNPTVELVESLYSN